MHVIQNKEITPSWIEISFCLFFNYPNHPATTVNAIVLGQNNRFVFFIVRYQAFVTKFLNIGITIDDEDTYLANINSIAFFN